MPGDAQGMAISTAMAAGDSSGVQGPTEDAAARVGGQVPGGAGIVDGSLGQRTRALTGILPTIPARLPEFLLVGDNPEAGLPADGGGSRFRSIGVGPGCL